MGRDAETDRVIEEAIVTLRNQGAVIVDPIAIPDYVLQARQGIFNTIRNAEFKAQIADYLRTLKPGYPKTLEELASKANDPQAGYRSPGKAFGLKYSTTISLGLDDPLYLAAKNEGMAFIKSNVEALFSRHQLDVILYPTASQPATLVIPVPEVPKGSGSARSAANVGAGSPLNLANLSGFPDLVVPAGMTKEGLPVAISFLGLAFTEPKLLGYGYDFEQATSARVLPKYTPALAGDVIVY